MKIVIDAGHGLTTAGKRCPDDSMREFHFNSAVARYIREELAGYTTVTGGDLTVKFVHDEAGNVDVSLSQRVATANGWNADVYVSIHANAFGSGWNDANGIETFAATVASQTSVKLAQAVQRQLIIKTGRKDRSVKRADFTVIAKTTMPAILVEAGFMTHREEAALLKTDAYRRKVASAIVEGLAEVYGLKRNVVTEPTKPTEPSTPVNTKTATLSPVNVIVNGTKLNDGHITNSTTYVPAREIAAAIGGMCGVDVKVTWDAATRTVSITK
ncbi:N-acetylmuramoyl-L-alanine amidase [Paenibacillus sp. NPDC057967]|uniref:N-acetylmuramoyl-L-alanine amidase n=1 Tax=Paenibacillus sp. NPDC057967 TaxID=3346293 RepID=UPI0036DE990F